MELTKKLRKSLERHLTVPVKYYASCVHPELHGATVYETEDGPLIHKQRGAKVLAVGHMDWVYRALEKGQKPLWRGEKKTAEWGYWETTPHGRKYITYTKAQREEQEAALEESGPKDIMQHPALDDRLGLWIILEVLPLLGVECDILLCDSEEIGKSTAKRWQEHIDESVEYNWLVEFDRMGEDVVFYTLESPEWREAWKATGRSIGTGSFTDISALDHLKTCAVNIGISYHRQHHSECYAEIPKTLEACEIFAKFWEQHKDTKFVRNYSPPKYESYWRRGYAGSGVGNGIGGVGLGSITEDYDDYLDYVLGEPQYALTDYESLIIDAKLPSIHRRYLRCPKCNAVAHESGACYECEQQLVLPFFYLEGEAMFDYEDEMGSKDADEEPASEDNNETPLADDNVNEDDTVLEFPQS